MNKTAGFTESFLQDESADFETPDLATQYDPKALNGPNTDHKTNNDVIIAAYHDTDVSPKSDPQAFHHNINSSWEAAWAKELMGEREWSNADQTNGWPVQDSRTQLEGPTRAIAFTSDIASYFDQKFNQIEADKFSSTETGKEIHQEMRAQFDQILSRDHSEPDADHSVTSKFSDEQRHNIIERIKEKSADSSTTNPETINTFVENNPNTWEQRYETFDTFCREAMELGRFLTYKGIMESNEEMLSAGRRIMDHSVKKLEELLTDQDKGEDLLDDIVQTKERDYWPSPEDEPKKFAAWRFNSLEQTVANFYEHPNDDPKAEGMNFLALTALDRDIAAFHDQTHERLNHAISTETTDYTREVVLTKLVEAMFQDQDTPLTAKAKYATESHDINTAMQAYTDIADFQHTIIAMAHSNYENSPDLKRYSEEEVERTIEDRLVHGSASDINQYLQEMIEQVEHLTKGQETSSIQDWIRQAATESFSKAMQITQIVVDMEWHEPKNPEDPKHRSEWERLTKEGAALTGLAAQINAQS